MTLVYAGPLLLMWLVHVGYRRWHQHSAIRTRDEAIEAGLVEPPSLHPVIDVVKCIGCGSCVSACPERPVHQVLGLIGGKSQLISPADCIGHGACKTACPVDAIQLMFGTATRGIDIPVLSPSFETNVPGVFAAGELGGMGLIRNAVEQGRQAVEAIISQRARCKGDGYDLVIVGGGPAGFAAALAAKANGLRYLVLEQDSLGGCVFKYPRGKLVMTSPAKLPIVGTMDFRHTSKEALMEYWRAIEREQALNMQYFERVERVEADNGEFIVHSSKGQYRAATVLLAIGRRGTPRTLGVPGEELSKVVYHLIEPEQYENQDVLVVGGGDSALEAAMSIADASRGKVALSYRGNAFSRAKQLNRQKLEQAERDGTVQVFLESNVQHIAADHVALEHRGKSLQIPNQSVIVNVGGVLPNDFLRSIGIDVKTHWGAA